MVSGFGEYNYWEEIGMALQLLKFQPPRKHEKYPNFKKS